MNFFLAGQTLQPFFHIQPNNSANKLFFFLKGTSPNSYLFHCFKSSLVAFNLRANTKLGNDIQSTLMDFKHKTLHLQPHIFKLKRISPSKHISCFQQKRAMIRHTRKNSLNLIVVNRKNKKIT